MLLLSAKPEELLKARRQEKPLQPARGGALRGDKEKGVRGKPRTPSPRNLVVSLGRRNIIEEAVRTLTGRSLSGRSVMATVAGPSKQNAKYDTFVERSWRRPASASALWT